MDPNVFHKGDASSCLVVGKTWADIKNKPAFFNELVHKLLVMMGQSEKIGLALKSDTLKEFKAKIQAILLGPLKEPYSDEGPADDTGGDNLINADAFWDEILSGEEDWSRLQEALERAGLMKNQIDRHILENDVITDSSTLQNVKDNFNDTIVKPLQGINEDE